MDYFPKYNLMSAYYMTLLCITLLIYECLFLKFWWITFYLFKHYFIDERNDSKCKIMLTVLLKKNFFKFKMLILQAITTQFKLLKKKKCCNYIAVHLVFL